MLQVARLSPKQLGESRQLVTGFLQTQLHKDGGFQDRAGNSDLYYTVFGLEALIALGADLPVASAGAYLRGFGDGDGLDFVHLCCLARCWANLGRELSQVPVNSILARIESHRAADGGYSTAAEEEHGSVYGCFLAMGAYQDLRRDLPEARGILRCLTHLRADDGGYANQGGSPMGLTPSTAAAATLIRHLGEEAPAELGEWLLSRCHKEGGFFATPAAPIPDLLSTATALHALSGMKVPFDSVREPCLDFLDSLWTNSGGFYGNWTDDAVDCEYTYYGLLALGHLSL